MLKTTKASVSLSVVHRADHHRRWREHPSCAHRGRIEERGAHPQQRHAARRQAQVPLHAAHSQSKRASIPAVEKVTATEEIKQTH